MLSCLRSRAPTPSHLTALHRAPCALGLVLVIGVGVLRGACVRVCGRVGWQVGAHSSGLMGEDPRGPPNNLMPFVAQVQYQEAVETSREHLD